jgi:hypothetical protein
MSRTTSVTVSSATTSAAIPVNFRANNFGIGFGVDIGGGTLTYKVQHTFSDLQNGEGSAVWFDHSTVTGKTVNSDGNYAYPVTAIRLNVTAYTSGSATLHIVENG